jgi:hypothetical protein
MPDAQQQTLASAVIATLVEVRAADGDNVACQIAVGNIRASTRFLLDAMGPQAARRALIATAAALEEDIKVANANSEWMQ